MSRGLTLFDTPFVASNVTDWASRVVANGGAMPSAGTIAAMETFRLALISNGLSSKMKSVCVFVPDSIIAATTPLIVGIGSDPWTNTGFTGSHLNVEGLMGGGSRYLNTGVKAKEGQAIVSGNVGLTCVITETDGHATGSNIGYQDGVSNQLMLIVSGVFGVSGVTYYTINGPALGNNVNATDWNRCGYVSGNSVGGVSSVYEASPLRPHATLTSGAVTASPTATENTLYAFATNDAGTAGGFRAERMSFVAIHEGLTSGESATFASLIFTLRTSLGGGTGDEVENWANRSVTLGGTSIASNTKDALRTFYEGLVSASILSKMVSVNCVVPDNLLAARQPLIWNAGNELWTNNNFVGGDLTVNGLAGNGTTKYLSTGVNNSTAQILTNDSGGISVMVYSRANDAQVMGGTIGSGSTHFTLVCPLASGGSVNYYCWGFSGADGTNHLTRATTVGSIPGFISGNRTASNAIAIYTGSSGTGFLTAGTGTGARTQSRFNGQMLAWAGSQDGSSSPGGYLDGTMSFVSVHAGLSASEAEDLYDLVDAMRTTLGGGNP